MNQNTKINIKKMNKIRPSILIKSIQKPEKQATSNHTAFTINKLQEIKISHLPFAIWKMTY